MIETVTLTGARHITLQDVAFGRRGKQRRRRLVLLAFAALLLVAATIGGTLLFRHQQTSTPSPSGRSSEATSPAAALPALPPPNLFRPLTPEEAQKANAERPVEQTVTTPAQPFKLRADEINRLRAIDCLTQAIYYEAASEGVDGGRAVAQVVLNRMRHGGYPNSVCGVVYQGSQRATGCQFTFTCDGSLARTPVPYLWARSRQIASEALAGRIFAPVGYATHYHADYVVPYWAASLDKIAVVGRHIFYNFRGAVGARSAFRQVYAGAEPSVQVPMTEVISDSLDTLENVTAPAEPAPEIKVEADRVEALAPAQQVKTQESSPLKADLARGQLILGEAVPATRSKQATASTDGCKIGQVRQVQPLGATNVRIGAAKDGC